MKKGVTQSITETRSLLSRRGFLRIGALACAAGPLKVRYAKSDNQAAAKARTSSDPEAIAASLEDNIYTRLLGVRPHLGAHEHISRLSGSRMSEEVMQAMAEANEFFVDMHELGAAAGRHIAKIMGARRLAHELQGIPGLTAEYAMNTMGYADVDLSWDKTIIPLTEEEARKKLAEGHPRVIYDETVRTCQLRDGEDVLLARRLREFFENAARKG